MRSAASHTRLGSMAARSVAAIESRSVSSASRLFRSAASPGKDTLSISRKSRKV